MHQAVVHRWGRQQHSAVNAAQRGRSATTTACLHRIPDPTRPHTSPPSKHQCQQQLQLHNYIPIRPFWLGRPHKLLLRTATPLGASAAQRCQRCTAVEIVLINDSLLVLPATPDKASHLTTFQPPMQQQLQLHNYVLTRKMAGQLQQAVSADATPLNVTAAQRLVTLHSGVPPAFTACLYCPASHPSPSPTPPASAAVVQNS